MSLIQIVPKFILFCLLCLFAFANKTETSVSSDTFSFDGHLVLLSGHVKLKHPLGELCADTARLKKEMQTEHSVFSKVILKDHVNILLKDKSKIDCDLARLDFNTLLGDLTSFTGPINYEGDFAKLGKMSLLANAINFKLAKTNHLDVDHLMATGSVKASIEDRYKLSADKITYHRMSPLNLVIKKNVPEGIVRAYRNCHFESDQFDLTANSIFFDMRSYLIQAIDTKGQIILEDNPISFIANRASYDVDKGLISLEEGSIITNERFGLLEAKQTVQILKNKNGAIDHIFIQGPMKYTDLQNLFTCDGTLTINQKTGVLIGERKTALPQIFYENEAFSVYSNYVKMLYSSSTAAREVERIESRGEVLLQLKNRQEPLQKAICDHLYYLPKEKKIHLIADPGKMVYLYHGEDETELVAEEIVIEAKENGEKFVRCTGESIYKTKKT